MKTAAAYKLIRAGQRAAEPHIRDLEARRPDAGRLLRRLVRSAGQDTESQAELVRLAEHDDVIAACSTAATDAFTSAITEGKRCPA